MLISDNTVERKIRKRARMRERVRERERSNYIKTFFVSICKTSFISDCLELNHASWIYFDFKTSFT